MITLEEAPFGPGTPCDECGAPTSTVRGFLYEDGDAHAVYFASWSACTPQRVKVAIVAGSWDDDADKSERRRFGFDVRNEASALHVRVSEPEESPWNEPSELSGPMLAREQALAEPDLSHLFHLVEHVAEDDTRIAGFLAATRS